MTHVQLAIAILLVYEGKGLAPRFRLYPPGETVSFYFSGSNFGSNVHLHVNSGIYFAIYFSTRPYDLWSAFTGQALSRRPVYETTR